MSAMGVNAIFMLLLVALTGGGDPPAQQASETPCASHPNFIFILADDQAWNGTSVAMEAGNPKSRSPNFNTPNLERLAAAGMTFSSAYAAHPKCECSRAAILTGRSTSTLNATARNARNWSAPASDSLANSLKRACPDYRAAHLGKWQWSYSPESMGYDLSDGITQNETGNSTDPDDPKLSMSLTRRGAAFMAEAVKAGQPFYLQLSYYAVHPTAQALPATLKKYEGMQQGKGARADRATLAAMTEDLDTCIGTLLAKVESLGIAGSTYIIYSSDNGGRTAYLTGGKMSLMEGGIRVPLIVAGPGVPRGSRCAVPVISYDIMPTVLDLAAPGSSIPKGVEGGSWRTLWDRAADKEPRVARPIDRMVWHQPTEVEHPQSAMRKGEYKLYYEWDSRMAKLFDISKDPCEKIDLAAEMPELCAALKSEMFDHIRAGIGESAFAALERKEFPHQGNPPRPPTAKP